MHPSVAKTWQQFITNSAFVSAPPHSLTSWHFCENQHDADECARLVVAGLKRATAPSLWSFSTTGEQLPRVGDLDVVTDWAGVAQCVIQTTEVDIVPFNLISEEHARAEGEGDGSLAWWRHAHWAYYQRELSGSGYQVQRDMPIVFQRFECVFCAWTGP